MLTVKTVVWWEIFKDKINTVQNKTKSSVIKFIMFLFYRNIINTVEWKIAGVMK